MAEKKTILITGATTGIGKATAIALAKQGHHIITHGRNPARTQVALHDIPQAAGRGQVSAFTCDLSSLDSVRSFAATVNQQFPQIDLLINNAGVMTNERKLSEDGFEMMVAVNHLAHFLLTGLLLDKIKAAPQGRIINLSSAVHTQGVVNFEDMRSDKKFSAFKVYGNSKLMNILFTRQLAAKLSDTPITVNALHPGVIGSDFARDLPGWMSWAFKVFAKSPESGAKTSLFLATDPTGGKVTGEYFVDSKVAKSSALSKDMELAERLWAWSEDAVGLQY